MKMHTVIAFDVSSDLRRTWVVKALKALAVRLQRSVFEAAGLEEAALLRLRSELEGKFKPEEDCIVYIRLCRACAGRMVVVGKRFEEAEPDEPVKVI
ncbi:MAG: CRISPR-associated endonuclease Cas2 [Myxococcota bacterium]|jgi:CRISPR-associated endonuclease Cas2